MSNIKYHIQGQLVFHLFAEGQASLFSHQTLSSTCTQCCLGVMRGGDKMDRGKVKVHPLLCPSKHLSIAVSVHQLTSLFSGQVLGAMPQQHHLIQNKQKNRTRSDAQISHPSSMQLSQLVDFAVVPLY